MKLRWSRLKFLNKEKPKLFSFTPSIFARVNDYYVDQLRLATRWQDKKNNNIALEGDYGTGKSSILEQLRSRFLWNKLHKPKTVSFMSFVNCDNSKELSRTIQSEIVRQLYYGESPNKLKGSGYKRTGKSYYVTSIFIATLIVVLALSLFYKVDWGLLLREMNFGSPWSVNFVNGSIMVGWLIIATIAIGGLINFVISAVANGNIKQFSAKDISIELSDKKPDFEQLIDLITFYFKKTGRRVIIFEDLDRFKNDRIFEELRRLNFVLNNRWRMFGKVKFIYAINGGTISDPANKAKIFDVVIPVVPFLSEANIDSVFRKEYIEAGFENEESELKVANILGRHTADMRTVKLILGYLDGYKHAYIIKDHVERKNCIALSVIKAFYPEEFKNLVLGEGVVNKIEKKCRTYRDKLTREIEGKYTIAEMIKTHAPEIWSEFGTVVAGDFRNISPQSVEIDGQKISPVDKGILVEIFNNMNKGVKITWGPTTNVSYNKDEIARIFKKFVDWSQEGKEKLESEKAKERQNLSKENVFKYFERIRFDEDNNGDLEDIVKDTPIIKELVENGFLTSDYVRFVSKSSFEDENEEATRYIFRSIRRGQESFDYPLSENTVTAILENIDRTDWASVGMYNFSLFDYLVSYHLKDSTILEYVVENARANLEKFLEFYSEYVMANETKIRIQKTEELVSEVDGSTEIIGVLYLTKMLAHKYPIELLHEIAQSEAGDENVKRILYSTAILELEKPENIEIPSDDRGLFEECEDIILKNGGGEKLFKLSVCNKQPIKNFGRLEISDKLIIENMQDVILEINRKNIANVSEGVLKEYIKAKGLSGDEFKIVINNARKGVKLYVAMNVNEVLRGSHIAEAYKKAAEYLLKIRCKMTVEELSQYAGRMPEEIFIKMVLLAELDKEDMVRAMSLSKSKELFKIGKRSGWLKLDKNSVNKAFVARLDELGLTNPLGDGKNGEIRRRII